MNEFNILVVDDEESQRASITGFLRKKGFTVDEAMLQYPMYAVITSISSSPTSACRT
jgi:CheY-like chemotaxis protein